MTEDEEAWMVISVDVNGGVVVNEVTKVGFFMYGDNRTLIDATNYYENGQPRFQTICTRFFSPKWP